MFAAVRSFDRAINLSSIHSQTGSKSAIQMPGLVYFLHAHNP